MPDRHPPTGTDRDDADRLGTGAITLFALGAPFVGAAPAAADGRGPFARGELPLTVIAGASAGAVLQRRVQGETRRAD